MISRRRFLQLLAGSGLFGIASAAYGAGIEARGLRVTRYHLRPPQWPADFPLKIAAISDLHACEPWMDLERIAGIVAHTNSLGADLIVLLGDYVSGMRQVTRYIPAAEWARVLGGLKAPLAANRLDRGEMRNGGTHGPSWRRGHTRGCC